MGGKNSSQHVQGGRLTKEELHNATELFKQIRQNRLKGCTYHEFVVFCKQIHPLLTQFLLEFYFRKNEHEVIENVREFVAVYTLLVRGTSDDKAKTMEVLILGPKDSVKRERHFSSLLQQNKYLHSDVNFSLNKTTARTKQENYLRGLICSHIKLEHNNQWEEFESWRRIKSRFSIADIDKLSKTLASKLENPDTPEDFVKWVRTWRTTEVLNEAVYGHLFGITRESHTKSLYPLCISKHRHNVCLMDMCSILHLNCYLPVDCRHEWRLLFNSAVHGVTFRFILDRILDEGPTLVLIRDTKDTVFGGFAPVSWQPSSTFYGTCASFVFQLDPALTIYPASGNDENYMFMCENRRFSKGFGMGKGAMDLFGWWIEPERGTGSCAISCPTFADVPVLASSQYFKIDCFEIWGVGEPPDRTYRPSNVRYNTMVSARQGGSYRWGNSVLHRSGATKYTDGYSTSDADQKWAEEENDEKGQGYVDDDWDSEEDDDEYVKDGDSSEDDDDNQAKTPPNVHMKHPKRSS